MAAEPITNLNGGVEPASLDATDKIAVVDVSDTTQAPTGTTKPSSLSKLTTFFNSALTFLSSVNLGYTASPTDGTVTNDGGTNSTIPLFDTTNAGLVGGSGGSATDFLSADGTWKAVGVEVDVCGIADANGVYTYYSTLQLAITAASSGDTVEIFADIVETADVTVILKNGVKINGNGHTYTLDFASATAALTVVGGLGIYYVYNLIVKRINGTTSSKSINGFGVGVSNNEYHFDGSKFYNTNGDAIDCGNGNSLYNAYGSTDLLTAKCIVSGTSSSKFYNCIGEGVGIGIQTSGGEVYGCKGISSGNTGLQIRGGVNCYGYSATLSGISSVVVAFGGGKGIGIFKDCTAENDGTLEAWGIHQCNNVKFHNCTAISRTNEGFKTNGGYNNHEMYNCYGYSATTYGIYGGRLYNCTAITDGGVAYFAIYGGGIYNSSFKSNFDNATGHAINLRAGADGKDIVNCTFEVTNSSAYCINQAFSSGTYNITNNTYKGSSVALDPTGITQGIINTSDSRGNILI